MFIDEKIFNTIFVLTNIMLSSFISVNQASVKWGITERRIQTLCNEGRIKSATRIGKMWMIPEDAEKPNDARLRKNSEKNDGNAHRMRLLVKRTILQLFDDNRTSDPFLTMQQTISYYASFLLRTYNNKNSQVLGSEELLFVETAMKRNYHNYQSVSGSYNVRAIEQQSHTLRCNKTLLDDSLSWAYQYLKEYCPNKLSSTQFFTERYMISTLVNNETISIEDNILDPSCGGGNFLMYVYEKKLLEHHQNDDYSTDTLNAILATLIGYDLDGFLSLVTYLNLIITSVRISSDNGCNLDVEEFSHLKTNVFASVDYHIGGFLDRGGIKIFNVCTMEKMPLSKLTSGVDYIFTNPPFETVKGMDEELKNYLKQEYPLCKCDLCIAFLLRIVEIMTRGMKCGLVLQNSWMYLKSYSGIRKTVCDHVALTKVAILGSGAFADISGEKASVSLVNISMLDQRDNITSIVDLTSYKRSEKESLLVTNGCNYREQSQLSLFGIDGSFKNDIIEQLSEENDEYSKYATPMQGTSTGDSKNLIDYFWKHLGDSSWKLVSKGGSYSRWYGLNMYVVHWGSNGEFIKETPGSALRNVRYFDDTSMVFSDTGTSGLNVRSLCNGQLFVASGPGIRISSGNVFNHLAFLNSKYASYCIRCSTPKLTIAAGYIAKIPVNKRIIVSDELSALGERCHFIKKSVSIRRPTDMEFNPSFEGDRLDETVEKLIIRELNEELEKITLEREIDSKIFDMMNIKEENRKVILKELDSEEEITPCTSSIQEIDSCLSSVLDRNCILSKTKTSKKSLGCDGPLEYVSRVMHSSPDSIRKLISDNIGLIVKTRSAYLDFIIHSKVLCELGYNKNCTESRNVEEISSSFTKDSEMVATWIRERFNTIHSDSFQKKPIYHFDERTDTIRWVYSDAF